MIALPWFPLYDFTQEIAIGGQLFVIRARHNEKEGRYSLDFFTRSMEPLMFGTSLIRGVDLFAMLPKANHPGGHLYVSGLDPTFDNLASGTAVVLYDATV